MRQKVLITMSICAACALMATPAFADDGRGGGRSASGGGGDNHARVTTAAPAQPRDDRGRGDDRPRPAASPAPQPVHVEREAEHEVEVEHVVVTPAPPPVATPVVVDRDDNRGPGNARDRDNAFADRDDNRGPGNAFEVQDDNRGPGNARDRDNDDVANVATVNDLVGAINNQVAALTNANVRLNVENEAEVNEVEVEHLQVISLSNLTAGLSAADATAVTNAVNANTSALQSFLGSGGANSNAIDAALNAIGVAPSGVLTILSDGEHLLAVTA
jgi:hypothetical protein